MPIKKSIPSPPGGMLTCSDEQLAIVEVRQGEVFAECISPPQRINDLPDEVRTQALQNWVLSTVTDDPRNLGQTITEDDVRILSEGRYLRENSIGEITMIEFVAPRQETAQRTMLRGGEAEGELDD